jgi:hypothetical protein
METLDINWNDIEEFKGSTGGMFEGEKVALDTLLNLPLAILKYRVSASSFFEGDFGMVQIMTGLNEKKWFTTSSKVLLKQLQEQDKNLPFKCKICKIKRYYTIKKSYDKLEGE